MRSRITAIALFLATIGTSLSALGTDRFYRDITAHSPSHRYQVEAKSPDNAGGGYKPFQGSFTYVCTDVEMKKVLWTRTQAMAKEKSPVKGSTDTFKFPKEAPPISIFVSDSGWTVIRTAWDDLIVVDSFGKDRGSVNLLKQGFTKEEVAKYVHDTTAGPMWSKGSMWNYLVVKEQEYFVVRPWWEREVIIDLKAGKLASDVPGMATALKSDKVQRTLDALKNAVAAHEKGDREAFYEITVATLTAIRMAGKDKLVEAIGLIQRIEDSDYVGTSSLGWRFGDDPNPLEIDPDVYEEYTLRQIAHTALRRLGVRPKPLPLTRFALRTPSGKPEDEEVRYAPKRDERPRLANVERIKMGMSPREVLDQVGEPDFVGRSVWEYDMDDTKPFTLVISWSERAKVESINKKSPPHWKVGTSRDDD